MLRDLALAAPLLTRGAISSAGRASRLHRGCRRFEPVIAHHVFVPWLTNVTKLQQRADATLHYFTKKLYYYMLS